MRSCDTAKQRLWLGTNRYRGGCRNAATNPNRVANSCVKRYALRPHDAHSYAVFTSSHTYAHSYSNTYSYDTAIPDAYAERYHTAESYTYGDSHRNSPAEGNAKAPPDSASAAVMP